MKKLFTAIRHGDLETVLSLLERKPQLISCTAKQPPKKDDGQSPLQVAVKCRQTEIANELIDRGANVNFMEQESRNEWKAPVLHDAIRAAVMGSGSASSFDGETYTEWSTKEESDATFRILQRILENGADVKKTDSYGNTVLDRLVLDVTSILPRYDWRTDTIGTEFIVTDRLRGDLTRIFYLLQEYGVNLNQYSDIICMNVLDFFAKYEILIEKRSE